MSIANCSCEISGTDPVANLELEIWLDNKQLFNIEHTAAPQKLAWEVDDVDADHELKFVMKNKTHDHTIVDSQGNIVKDARIIIKDLSFDGIILGQIVTDCAEYSHNFNNTGSDTVDKFYGEMGCNGTVSLKFSTPIYLWLLEHM